MLLSFTNWNGIGPLSQIKGIGLTNYINVATNYPPFWPALRHNLTFLAVLFLIATPIGMFLAVLLDKEMRFSRFYQTAIYLPVVLSLALVGFIWQLIYSRDQGLLNAVLHTQVDWYGDPNYNLWAALVATSWRHIGYIMLLYLAGLKAVDGDSARGRRHRRRLRGADVLPRRLPGDAADQRHRPGGHGDRVAARVRPRLGDQQGPQRIGADRHPRHGERRRRGAAGSASARRWPRSCC